MENIVVNITFILESVALGHVAVRNGHISA